MLTVRYQKTISYDLDVVYGQYYDYEHIAVVHPNTLGEYRLVSTHANDAVYEQIWPRGRFSKKRGRSVVRHSLLGPYEMEFVFTEGRHKGVRVHTKLSATDGGTLIDEAYSMPGPNWSWLAKLIRPFVMRSVDRVWEEDLDVEVCHGGWPGIPPYGNDQEKS